MDERIIDFVEKNEFLSVYYHKKLFSKKEYAYQNVYYRLYGLDSKTYKWVNVPELGTFFIEIGDVYDYINNINEDSYEMINIIKYNPLTKTDELYDTIKIKKVNNLVRKKK